MDRAALVVWALAVALIAVASGTPPDRPAVAIKAPAPADGEWIPQVGFDGQRTGDAFRWHKDHPIWQEPANWLYVPGTLWEIDDVKLTRWVEASRWGRPTFVLSRLPTTAEFPVSWVPTGHVFSDGYTYRMRIEGPAVTSVNLRTGSVDWHGENQPVRGVVVRIGVQTPE